MRVKGPAAGRRVAALSCFAIVAAATLVIARSDDRNVQVQAGLAGDPKTTEAYLGANITFVRKTVPEAIRTCATDLEDEAIASFDLVVTVTGGGKIESVTRDPETAFTSCVARAVSKATLTDPPQARMDVYVEVSITH